MKNRHDGIAVESVFLQSPTTIHGVFTTQTNLNKNSYPNLTMVMYPEWLVVTDSKTGISSIIPSANVKMALLPK